MRVAVKVPDVAPLIRATVRPKHCRDNLAEIATF